MMLMLGLVAFVYYGAGLRYNQWFFQPSFETLTCSPFPILYSSIFSSNLIGGDIFLDFALVAVIEAVADLINMVVIDHVGRKTNLVFV